MAAAPGRRRRPRPCSLLQLQAWRHFAAETQANGTPSRVVFFRSPGFSVPLIDEKTVHMLHFRAWTIFSPLVEPPRQLASGVTRWRDGSGAEYFGRRRGSFNTCNLLWSASRK